jgi:hypothetical protein
MARVCYLAAFIATIGVAHADTVVEASAPQATSVTIYRAPGGSGDLGDSGPPRRLDGYALISEEREVDLPAGAATIRFPGVAAGMLAESVVVEGLPAGATEKNLDADLLSPRGLYAGWFGRPVTLRRTDPATGAVREEQAVIRSGADGAAVVETAQGFEAVQCGPFSDSIAYPGVPQGLFARPTLSIATVSPVAAHVRLRLAYLAWDYDWRANYVLKLDPDRGHATLSAWVTLASADVTSFPATRAAVVAGRPAFVDHRSDGPDTQDLVFHCRSEAYVRNNAPPMINSAVAPAPMAMDIVVTAMRRKAVYASAPEDLGDLKLYRLPLPTTVAARAQKQVALFEPRHIAVEAFHAAAIDQDGDDPDIGPARVTVRLRNRRQDGLGLALPAGGVAVMAARGDTALLAGQAAMTDRAIGETIDLDTAESPRVSVERTVERSTRHAKWVRVTVSNANRAAIRFVGTFRTTVPGAIHDASARLSREQGHSVWAVRVPGQGTATLRYRLAVN